MPAYLRAFDQIKVDTLWAWWILAGMQTLLAALATELERPRPVSGQVLKHVTVTYGVEREAVGVFLSQQLAELEDYEIDLILSPLFTPTLQDQAVIAELLGPTSIPREQWPGLVRQLTERPVSAHLLTEDGQSQTVLLRDVTIERYVNRLRLDATIPEPLLRLIAAASPSGGRPLLKAIARRAIWENEARREILVRYLLADVRGEAQGVDDTVELLKLMETYAPADLPGLLSRIPHWEQVLRQEVVMASNPKPFFNERVQELHGGGRDQRSQDEARIAAKERELAFLDQLKKRLAST